MRKHLILTGFVLLSVFLSKCTKHPGSQPLTNDDLIQSARQYFERAIATQSPSPGTILRISDIKTPLWDAAIVTTLTTEKAVIVPIQYTHDLHVRTGLTGTRLFNLNELTHLLIYHDKEGNDHAELVTAFPDSLTLQGVNNTFSGLMFIEDWTGDRLRQYKFNPDGSVQQADPDQTNSAKGKQIPTSANATSKSSSDFTICYEITGYNYSPDDPDGGISWSEPAGCVSTYYPVTQSLAPNPSPSDYGAIAGSNGHVSIVDVYPPDNPIEDIQAYFGCFTNGSAVDHSYTVTVCVSQPVPDSRSPWAFTSGGPAGSSASQNPFNTGHTFLIFSENSAGNIITRNVGFYPLGMVNPYYPSDQGILDNNEKSPYNISLTFTVTGTQFFAMLGYASIGNNPGYFYDLNANNCTTFVIHTLAAGSIMLTAAQGVWPGGGHGYDPGDLGEDIRSMSLPSNATRNTVQNLHSNQGNCN